MSMYGVNASIPKTLVRYLTAFEASRSEETLRQVLLDVLEEITFGVSTIDAK